MSAEPQLTGELDEVLKLLFRVVFEVRLVFLFEFTHVPEMGTRIAAIDFGGHGVLYLLQGLKELAVARAGALVLYGMM
jgi:hypothetical protein